MSERDVIARLDRIESQLGKVLRILEHNLKKPPAGAPQLFVYTPEQIDQWEREGDEMVRRIEREIDEEERNGP